MLREAHQTLGAEIVRGLAAAALAVGIVLIIASPILLLYLGTTLIRCPNPGVCYEETLWGTYLVSTVAFAAGLACIVAAALLNRRVAAREHNP